MPPRSATRPIRPSKASISRTRWPLPRPPMAGLQLMAPTVAKRCVTSAVRAPMRALTARGLATGMAAANDHNVETRTYRLCHGRAFSGARGRGQKIPVLPNVSRETLAKHYKITAERLLLLNFLERHVQHRPRRSWSISPARRNKAVGPYLPMQKSRKITSRMSSTSTRPVRRPSARVARRNSSASRSSLAATSGTCAR